MSDIKLGSKILTGVTKVSIPLADGSGNATFSEGVVGIGYTITFVCEGETYYVASCLQGDSIAAPPAPSVSGILTGWSLTEGGAILSFPYTPTSNLTLYAIIDNTWTATVAGLGSSSPSSVSFTKSSNFPTTWETVTQDGVEFVKIPKMYKKINSISSNQITSYTISNGKSDSNYQVYPCFLDEVGNELDYILIAKSISYLTMTIATARVSAQSKGKGYQLMDWKIKRLWEDLIIVLYNSVNINSGSGITTDKLGLNWSVYYYWVDGIAKNDTTWVACDKPSKYVDTPTSSTDGYYALSYSAPSTSNTEIQKLGYDSNHPFVNMPNAVVSNSSYNTYYCDYYSYNSGNRPVGCAVGGSDAYYGAFYCCTDDAWSLASSICGSRLCYLPLSA